MAGVHGRNDKGGGGEVKGRVGGEGEGVESLAEGSESLELVNLCSTFRERAQILCWAVPRSAAGLQGDSHIGGVGSVSLLLGTSQLGKIFFFDEASR